MRLTKPKDRCTPRKGKNKFSIRSPESVFFAVLNTLCILPRWPITPAMPLLDAGVATARESKLTVGCTVDMLAPSLLEYSAPATWKPPVGLQPSRLLRIRKRAVMLMACWMFFSPVLAAWSYSIFTDQVGRPVCGCLSVASGVTWMGIHADTRATYAMQICIYALWALATALFLWTICKGISPGHRSSYMVWLIIAAFVGTLISALFIAVSDSSTTVDVLLWIKRYGPPLSPIVMFLVAHFYPKERSTYFGPTHPDNQGDFDLPFYESRITLLPQDHRGQAGSYATVSATTPGMPPVDTAVIGSQSATPDAVNLIPHPNSFTLDDDDSLIDPQPAQSSPIQAVPRRDMP